MADTLISDPQPPELMFTVTRALEEALFQHFICQKLEIAYAIHKPIPFFEDLRDKFFITERIYKLNCSRAQTSTG
ncbi:sp110 nuclear body protein-like isoform X3 [Loxodonta africana]|uniref:sp110 nuclear body protein-like isoform X3 n=1 Tax=Loxodonta africana TaxID=9785 RepID=UPI0030CE014D